MTKYSCIILIFFVNCAATPNFWLTKGDTLILDNNGFLDEHMVEAIILDVARDFNAEEQLHYLTVEFIYKSFDCGNTPNVAGCYSCGRNYIRVLVSPVRRWHECPYKTALVHELVHFFLESKIGNCDPQHSLGEYWDEFTGYVDTKNRQIKSWF